ncbi:MAG TPA: hypothetical protein VKB54_16945 [Solirubrobacteraceae bacterium]|nr:hypothetical protein [Solirubrobacteraceae bacterium]
MPSFPSRTLAIACGTITACGAGAFAQPTSAPPAKPRVVTAARDAPRRAVHPRRDHTHRRPLRRLRLSAHHRAYVPKGAPARVRGLIRAANRIARKPYVWGGGHGTWRAAGYDCSGSVSYALHGAGVLNRAATSGDLAAYGRAGKGRWVTIYANGGHAYMVVAGVRYDTSARSSAGSRWTSALRGSAGYVARHPVGL